MKAWEATWIRVLLRSRAPIEVCVSFTVAKSEPDFWLPDLVFSMISRHLSVLKSSSIKCS